MWMTTSSTLQMKRQASVSSSARCRDRNITISKEIKSETRVKFTGFLVTSSRVKPDPEKVSSISDFPVPTDVSALCFFICLANQIGGFMPNLAHQFESLRQLLKKKVAFNLLPDHRTAIEKPNEALTSSILVKYFDLSLRTELLTDVSWLKGLGFSLIQKDGRNQI